MSRNGPPAGAAPGENSTLERIERENETLVRSFCAAWSAMDPDRIAGYLAPDCVYQLYENGPVKRGVPEIHRTLVEFMQRWRRVEFEIFRLSAMGNFVLHERRERYTGRDGHPDWEFNVTGLLLIRDGRIRRWRDDALPGARQVFTLPNT